MESNIKNAKFIIFNSKEEYLAMRQAWRDFHNSGRAKGSWVEEQHKVYNWRTRSTTLHTNRKKITPLSGCDYLLYNLLRGKPAHHGFMSDVCNPTEGYVDCYLALEQRIKRAVTVPVFSENTSESTRKWALEHKASSLAMLKKPFGDALTEDHLRTVLDLWQKGHFLASVEDLEEATT